MGKPIVVDNIPRGSGKVVSMVSMSDRIVIACEYAIFDLIGEDLFLIAKSETIAKEDSPIPSSF